MAAALPRLARSSWLSALLNVARRRIAARGEELELAARRGQVGVWLAAAVGGRAYCRERFLEYDERQARCQITLPANGMRPPRRRP
jgi:hypothetical protein